MEKNGQLNVRIGSAHRRKLEALAAGYGVTVGRAVALLLDTVPVEPVSRTVSGLALAKNSAHGVLTTTSAASSVRS